MRDGQIRPLSAMTIRWVAGIPPLLGMIQILTKLMMSAMAGPIALSVEFKVAACCDHPIPGQPGAAIPGDQPGDQETQEAAQSHSLSQQEGPEHARPGRGG